MPEGMMGLLLENRNADLELEPTVAAGHPMSEQKRNGTHRQSVTHGLSIW